MNEIKEMFEFTLGITHICQSFYDKLYIDGIIGNDFETGKLYNDLNDNHTFNGYIYNHRNGALSRNRDFKGAFP